MIALESIPELDRQGLRRFGLMTGGIVAGLFGVFFPWLLERNWPIWPWLILLVLGGLAAVAPNALKPVHKGWMTFGLLANRVTTPVILSIVFFVVISPMGLIRRAMGRDAMARTFDEQAKTYRVKSVRKPAKNCERPF